MTREDYEQELIRKAGEKEVPINSASGLINYIVYGIEPGGFLKAVIKNDLMQAFSHADHVNILYMKNIVMFLYNDCPMNCWGSEEALRNWEGIEIK